MLGCGIDIVQLRCKGVSASIFLKYALRLRRLSRAFNVIFIVNDRADIAIASDADGLHIGQDDIPPSLARKILGKDRIIGLSTHNLAQIGEAKTTKDIDYIGVGPIFKTDAKPDIKPLGLSIIRDISKKRRIPPFFAIGGINISNIDRLVSAGAKRIAVSRGVFNSKNPIKTIECFREILYDSD